MRLLPWFVLAISLAPVSTAEARLFWQTYGSTIPTADGGGCTWNWNQDYFMPRHPSSCRYGLHSPCQSQCQSPSPACSWGHPWHHGYCGIYGPCHYHHRDHVYKAYCGCSPIRAYPRRCGAPGAACCSAKACFDNSCCGPEAPLYNVEPAQPHILGSISIEGGGDFLPVDAFPEAVNVPGNQKPLPQENVLPQLLEAPILNLLQLAIPN